MGTTANMCAKHLWLRQMLGFFGRGSRKFARSIVKTAIPVPVSSRSCDCPTRYIIIAIVSPIVYGVILTYLRGFPLFVLFYVFFHDDAASSKRGAFFMQAV